MAKRESDPPPETIAAFRAETASPEDVEHLIDFRVGQIDEEIKEHQAAIERARTERKRWIGVTGGRSRLGNGSTEPEHEEHDQ